MTRMALEMKALDKNVSHHWPRRGTKKKVKSVIHEGRGNGGGHEPF